MSLRAKSRAKSAVLRNCGACKLLILWCRGAELNRRHTDFQSVALPTELPRHLETRRTEILSANFYIIADQPVSRQNSIAQPFRRLRADPETGLMSGQSQLTAKARRTQGASKSSVGDRQLIYGFCSCGYASASSGGTAGGRVSSSSRISSAFTSAWPRK